MAKFHINPQTGRPSPCNAQPGNCPFASDEEHFDSFQEAQDASDNLEYVKFVSDEFRRKHDKETGTKSWRYYDDIAVKPTVGAVYGKKNSEKEPEKPTVNTDFTYKAVPNVKDLNWTYADDEGQAYTIHMSLLDKVDKARETSPALDERNELFKNALRYHKGIVDNHDRTFAECLDDLRKPDAGATFKIDGSVPMTGFMASPYPELSEVVKIENVSPDVVRNYYVNVVRANPSFAHDKDIYIGLWHSPHDGKLYMDISRRYTDAYEAQKACLEHDQQAFFDLTAGDSVTVDPNAKSGQE